MGATATTGSAGSTAGSGAGGQIASAVVGVVISSAFASSDAKKQREMQAKLDKLSLAQQKELEIRAQNVQGELGKQEIIYKYLAVQNNDEALAKIQGKRYTSYAILGGGVFILAIVVLLIKNKKK